MTTSRKEFYNKIKDDLNTKIAYIDPGKADENTNGQITATIEQNQAARDYTIAQFEAADNIIKAIQLAEQPASFVPQITEGERMFIAGVKSHQEAASYFNFSNEWGYPYDEQWNVNLLGLIAGLDKIPYSNYTSQYIEAHRLFRSTPQLYKNVSDYFQSNIDAGEQYARSPSTNYGAHPFIITALRNISSNPIIVPIKYRGTAYTAYSPLVFSSLIPDQPNANRAAINSLAFTQENNYTSSTNGIERIDTVTIPADKSVILIWIASHYYYTTYTQGMHLNIKDVNAMFADPNIVVDKDIMINLNKGWKGESTFSTLEDLWKVTPSIPALSEKLPAIELTTLLQGYLLMQIMLLQ